MQSTNNERVQQQEDVTSKMKVTPYQKISKLEALQEVTQRSEEERLHHLADATVAIEPKHQNGDVVLMEHAHFAMPAGCIMQN